MLINIIKVTFILNNNQQFLLNMIVNQFSHQTVVAEFSQRGVMSDNIVFIVMIWKLSSNWSLATLVLTLVLQVMSGSDSGRLIETFLSKITLLYTIVNTMKHIQKSGLLYPRPSSGYWGPSPPVLDNADRSEKIF